jgi:hypothetical protein
VFVRKRAKVYGTRQLAEGLDVDGLRVLVIEDVATSGGQVVASTNDLRALGATLHGFKDTQEMEHPVGSEFTVRFSDVPERSVPRALWGQPTRSARALGHLRRVVHNASPPYGADTPSKYRRAFAHACAPISRPIARDCRSASAKWMPP